MRTKKPYLFLLCLLHLAGIAVAQRTQSAMYDAIAMMNAKNGINALFNGHPHGYDIIDPLGVNQPLLNKQITPDSFTNNAATSQNIIASILRRNAHLSSNAPNDSLVMAYANNPFLKDIFNQNQAGFAIKQDDRLAGIYGFMTSDQSGAVGGNISGNIVNGVADFLVKRASEELSISVFTKLQTFINTYPEFNVLFPKTRALLKSIDPYDYAKTLAGLKSAIQQDLNGLPAQLPQLYQLPGYQLLNKKVPELTLVFASAQLFSQLHGKSSLSKSLHDLDTASCLIESNNYATMIHLTVIASNSMRKKLITDAEDGDYPYFSIQDIKLATHNDPGYTAQLGKFYLGLLWQQVSGYQIYDKDGGHPIADLIGRYINQTASIFNQFIAAADKLNSIGQQLATLKIRDDGLKLTGQNIMSDDRFIMYNQLLVGTMQMLQPFVQGPSADRPWKQQLASICTYWPPFSASGISLLKDLSAKSYNLAITDLSAMLSSLSAYQLTIKADKQINLQLTSALAAQLDTNINIVVDQIRQIDSVINTLPQPGSIPVGNVKTAVVTQIQYLAQNKSNLKLQLTQLSFEKTNIAEMLFNLPKVLSYIDLLASLCQAGNSGEVETILENYALPAGSSRVKKDAYFNIAVNSYVGGFYRGSNPGTGFTNSYGLTAPIGITFSRGFQKFGSASLFAGIVDVGSVVRYKLDTQGQYEQNINLAGLVSPSIQLVYGIGGYLPISIGGGWQWTSPVTSTSNSINLQSHFNIFLAVDIPLFNLYVVKPK